MQLGLLAEAQGEYATAAGRLGQAIDREDRNWLLYYLRSQGRSTRRANAAAARADLAGPSELNPLESCLREGWDGCG